MPSVSLPSHSYCRRCFEGFKPPRLDEQMVYAIRERTEEGEEIFKLLTSAGAEYDLHAAVARTYVARIRQVLSDNPEAVKKAPNPDQLLIDALIGLADDCTANPEIVLDLLFGHGLSVTARLAESLSREYGGRIAELLAMYTK